ncbi:MAG: hypothetical protein V1754_02190, partial [Pseudomonadota bacterium]
SFATSSLPWSNVLLISVQSLSPVTGNIQTPNAANHRRQKAERRRSGAFWRPSAFALLGFFTSLCQG